MVLRCSTVSDALFQSLIVDVLAPPPILAWSACVVELPGLVCRLDGNLRRIVDALTESSSELRVISVAILATIPLVDVLIHAVVSRATLLEGHEVGSFIHDVGLVSLSSRLRKWTANNGKAVVCSWTAACYGSVAPHRLHLFSSEIS